jgi:biopolymer transport protein ExbD
MRIELGDEEQPEIGLIALIDCIFFLLMFFMVATTFKQIDTNKKEKELPIILPASAAALNRLDAVAPPLVIGVDKDGKFFYDAEPISPSALLEKLHKEAALNPARQVRIDGDQRTPYRHIVQALDLCQFARLTNIAMHTKN